jgi:hypothetical protein
MAPIKNNGTVTIPMTGDRLYEWLRQNTKPTDTFVSEMYIFHPILLSGRRLYFGYPTFSWSAGYDVGSRQPVYREMLTTRSPRELVRRLQANDIAYVAIDDGLRNQAMVAELNESVYREHLEIAFDDADNRPRLLRTARRDRRAHYPRS